MLNIQTAPIIKQESNKWKSWFPKRGEVYLIDLGQEGKGSEQRGLRPAVIVSNDKGNAASSIIQVAPVTSQKKNKLPVHVELNTRDGLKTESLICIEQAKCISKERGFINGNIIKITQLSDKKLREIDAAIKIQFGLQI